ncbi:MAG: pyridoxal phosphate-dependent aminotransferase [Deltaproteobacteria bacterium]|jgi:aspartate aminotransferase|nr:pyridoxal phosphate-dependent aminotransferase [Deltaproteobacteria bacterium]
MTLPATLPATFPLAERVGKIKPSPTLTLDAEVKSMKAGGKKIVNLGIGEPDFETPDHIKEAAIKAVRDGFTKYTPSEGILELREAWAAKFREDNSLDYSPDRMVVTNGGKHALYNAAQVLFGPGDEVIIPSPYWVTYPDQIRLSGATPVFVETLPEDNFVLKPERLLAAITDRTKGIIINSPSNPAGALHSREDLLALAPVLEEKRLWIISDDIYETLVYDEGVFCNVPMAVPDLMDRTVICHGVSKTYSMTGWRIGVMAAPREVARAAAKLQSQMTSNPCSIAQKAALAALTGPREPMRKMFEVFSRRRRLVLDLLRDIPGFETPVPKGAFYVFPDVSKILGDVRDGKIAGNSDDLSSLLLKECEVATVPGSGFGRDEAIRFSYAASEEEIKEGLGRISRFLTGSR